MKTLFARLFAILALAMTSSVLHAQDVYINKYCEAEERPAAKAACYRENNNRMLAHGSMISKFYGRQLPGMLWQMPQEVLMWRMGTKVNSQSVGELFNKLCGNKPACVFDLLIKEEYAIEEKVEAYQSGEASFKEEVMANYARRKEIEYTYHSDSQAMAEAYGLSNIDRRPSWMMEEMASRLD
jgi:hypothetical protein